MYIVGNIMIMNTYSIASVLLFTWTSLEFCNGANILFYPISYAKNSALRNMEKIAAILAEDSHSIYVLANEKYTLPEFLKSKAELIAFPRPVDTVVANTMEYTFSLPNVTAERKALMKQVLSLPITFCEALLSSRETTANLRNKNFDLLFLDGQEYCSPVIANMLKEVPSIQFLTFDLTWRLFNQEFPLPLAYVPNLMADNTVKMTFFQRIFNVLFYLIVSPLILYCQWCIKGIAESHEIHMEQVDSLGMVFGGFPVQNPAPIMPDTIYLDGFLVSTPKPLPKDLEDFVQSSGDNGVIMLSFGSMIKNYDEHYGNLFAEAFAKLPQNVLWKYEGPSLKNVGNNIKILKWLPQTDLLGHSKMKLFISHCGLNSMYETVQLGVPVLAIPLFGDQFSNAANLAEFHEMGVKLDLQSLTVETLLNAISEVINNPKYKTNAVNLSNLLNDKPISGKALLLYWVDYLLRHKSISHLKAYGRLLPWYQFYLVDVIVFLLAVVIFAVTVVWYTCRCLCVCCRKTRRQKAKDE